MSGRGERLKVGITIGDIAGIGPEVIIKTFLDERLYKLVTPVLFGNARVISFYRKQLNIDKFQYQSVKSLDNLAANSLNILPVWEEEVLIEPGKPSPATGAYALKSLQSACDALKSGGIDVLVTAPLNKHWVHTPELPFSGHTHYLMVQLGGEDALMFMVSENMRVGLVTEHVPVCEVSAHISVEGILRKLRLMYQSLVKDFGIDQPKIAVLGLNPHAGDRGLIGNEEQEVIYPAIVQAKQEGILCFGPYPADGFFANARQTAFDAILAMYHDQGLIPFKSLSIGEGTNYTAGLPYVRTSPDHGTAEDIAGKNQADESSFRKAIYTAVDIFQNRKAYQERISNPLEKLAKLKDEDR